MQEKVEPPSQNPGRTFATTHWSVVLAARDGDPTTVRRALEHLCSIYWPPIYAFLVRDGHRPAEAEDLTQGFFAHLLEQEFLTHLQHQNGRFRSFLLTFLKHYLADQRDRDRALKRGGGKPIVSLDQMAEEERMGFEPVAGQTPEQVYEQRWAQALMARAVQQLGGEYAASGRAALFDALKDLEPGERGTLSYAALGQQLGLTEQAVKNAAHRLRRRHGEIVREEIAQTLTNPAEIDDEIRHLLAVMSA